MDDLPTLVDKSRAQSTDSWEYDCIYIYIYSFCLTKARRYAYMLDIGRRFFLTGWLSLRAALGLRVGHNFGFRVVL